MALKNYADVQAALNAFVNQAGVTPRQAPHGAFWNSLTYAQFTNGNVPGVPAGPWKILIIGDSQNSNIIQILNGVGDAANDFGQMPQPNPPYNPEQQTLITELADWIDAGCPDGTEAYEEDEDAAPFTNYADVQAALNSFVNQAGVTPEQASHGRFWNDMTYTEFTTKDVPGKIPGSWKILVIGDSQNSNIIQILNGVGGAANNFGQMPRPNPPYNPEQKILIAQLAAWIDAGCPNNTDG